MKEDFGLFLKNEREMRGVSLEEISMSTKIHIRFLEALESCKFDQLPGEVFVKGYIRSYAKAIGSDVDEVLISYDESNEKKIQDEYEREEIAGNAVAEDLKKTKRFAVTAAAAVGVILIGLVLYKFFPKEEGNLKAVTAAAEAMVAENNVVPAMELEDSDAKVMGGFLEGTTYEFADADRSEMQVFPSQPLVRAAWNPEAPKPGEAKLVSKIPRVSKPSAVDSQPAVSARNVEPQPRVNPASPINQPGSEPKTETAKRTATAGQPLEKLAAEQMIGNAESGERASAEPVAELARVVPALEVVKVPESAEPSRVSRSSTGAIQEVEQEVEMESQSVAFHNPGSMADMFGDFSTPIPESDSKPLTLEIKVQENAWFNLTVDDSMVEDFILPSGTGKTFSGQGKFRVTIGNRHYTKLFLNGQAVNLPEVSGDVIRDFMVTADLLQ